MKVSISLFQNILSRVFFQFANHVLESGMGRMIHLSRLESAETLQQAPDVYIIYI